MERLIAGLTSWRLWARPREIACVCWLWSWEVAESSLSRRSRPTTARQVKHKHMSRARNCEHGIASTYINDESNWTKHHLQARMLFNFNIRLYVYWKITPETTLSPRIKLYRAGLAMSLLFIRKSCFAQCISWIKHVWFEASRILFWFCSHQVFELSFSSALKHIMSRIHFYVLRWSLRITLIKCVSS